MAKLAQTKTAPAAAKAAAPATVAPAAPATNFAHLLTVGAWGGGGTNGNAPMGKQATGFSALLAQGAYLVRVPCPANVLSNLLSVGMPALAIPATQVPALVKAHNWGKCNAGYLCGQNASYAACSYAAGNKKTKANAAFVWALPGGAMLTAMGTPFAAPAANAPAYVAGHYNAAQAAVAAAMAGGALPAAAAPAKAQA